MAVQVELDSGRQTLHHSGKLSGVNKLDSAVPYTGQLAMFGYKWIASRSPALWRTGVCFVY